VWSTGLWCTDGTELARNLRGKIKQIDIPILFMTAYPPEWIYDEEIGAPVIRKPFTAPALIDAIQRLLSNERTSSATERDSTDPPLANAAP
jgi:CheY-like chemotaxis protein